MNARIVMVFCLILAGVVVVFVPAPALAGLSGTMDSSSFLYQYEMNSDPATQNLDGNGTLDWAASSSAPTVSGGILSIGSGQYETGGNAGQIWNNIDTSVADGWTEEVRLKVLTQTTATGRTASVLLRPPVRTAQARSQR